MCYETSVFRTPIDLNTVMLNSGIMKSRTWKSGQFDELNYNCFTRLLQCFSDKLYGYTIQLG